MFVRRKRYDREMQALEFTIESLGKKVKQLECEHSSTRIDQVGYQTWAEVCVVCEYTVSYFRTAKEKLERELVNREKEVESIKNKIKSTV